MHSSAGGSGGGGIVGVSIFTEDQAGRIHAIK
jgi:hypothetical protein